ncbi:MAG: hypothetical protein E7680_05160 [Ruminococcaceae bacterium]|nr:hypothetical protein [Oscillospiraceae bacterium]
MKRKTALIFAIFLSVALLVSSCAAPQPSPSAPDSSVSENASAGLSFVSNGDGTCYLDSIGSCTDTEIVVPSASPAGDRVTAIGFDEQLESSRLSGFFQCEAITSVTIPEGVISIGLGAFYGCTSLTRVSIPDSVTRVNQIAFRGCTALEYTVYENAKYLGNEKNPYVVLVQANEQFITSCTIHSNAKAIACAAFADCTALTEIAIPEGFLHLDDYTFYRCTALVNVNLPHSLLTIGTAALSGCTALTGINYNGTTAEWELLEKYTAWDYGLGHYSVFCSDETLTPVRPPKADEIDLSPIEGDLSETYVPTETATDLVRMTVSYTTKDGKNERGDIYIRLFPDVAPETVANFKSLVGAGFYNGLTFHRVYPGFMIQGGDPKGDGTGSSGTNIKGEFIQNGFENNLSHYRGVISMARGSYSMDSASCQFFIVHDDAASTSLDKMYASFGIVVNGIEFVDAITEVELVQGTNSVDRVPTSPVHPVIIESVVFVKPKA